uniref:Uncharacterized protein n=1 Tax=Anguilla anguilla TaxID=7936 RepID=A0A0E9TW47_ANGAN
MSKNTVIIYSANPPDYQYKHEPQWKLCAAVLTGKKTSAWCHPGSQLRNERWFIQDLGDLSRVVV